MPESPHWLLMRHRSDDALKALQWLRGWVSPQMVDQEFRELQRYHKQSNACVSCVTQQGILCAHLNSTFSEICGDLLRKRVVKPTLMVLLISIFAQFAGLGAMRPYLVLTLKAYGVPIDPHWAAVSKYFPVQCYALDIHKFVISRQLWGSSIHWLA